MRKLIFDFAIFGLLLREISLEESEADVTFNFTNRKIEEN